MFRVSRITKLFMSTHRSLLQRPILFNSLREFLQGSQIATEGLRDRGVILLWPNKINSMHRVHSSLSGLKDEVFQEVLVKNFLDPPSIVEY